MGAPYTIQRAVKDYRRELEGLDNQKDKGRKLAIYSFVRMLVLAYYESFNKMPLASDAETTDQKFQQLAWDLASTANLRPYGHLVRSIRKAKRDIKASQAAGKP